MVAAMQIAASPSLGASIRVAHTRRRAGGRLVVRAENRVVREYREDDDKITNTPATESQDSTPVDPNSAYADELPPIPRTEMSAAMKAKLREEYYGLGGSPNKPMSGNYFLYIILIVSFLAVLSWSLGYLG